MLLGHHADPNRKTTVHGKSALDWANSYGREVTLQELEKQSKVIQDFRLLSKLIEFGRLAAVKNMVERGDRYDVLNISYIDRLENGTNEIEGDLVGLSETVNQISTLIKEQEHEVRRANDRVDTPMAEVKREQHIIDDTSG